MSENVYMLVLHIGFSSFENLIPGRVFTKEQLEDPITQTIISQAKQQYPDKFKIMTLSLGPSIS